MYSSHTKRVLANKYGYQHAILQQYIR